MHRLLLAAFFCMALGALAQDESVVKTQYGIIVGSVSPTTRSFKGIPYAAPPVKALRWQAPQAPAPWSNPLKTQSFQAGCPQACELPPFTCPNVTSENCLYLNVYTPRLAAMKNPIPVMVFFHGGNFQFGSAGTILYDGENFSPKGGVILVTVSYRLGILGFLYDGKTIKGNFGLLDQQMALRWVRDNIAQFGGDPSQVTIFGQSAGGMSCAAHLTAPDSFGLYSKAILHSNPMAIPLKDTDRAMDEAKYFYAYANCSYRDSACLSAKTADQIVAAQVLTAKKMFLMHPIEVFVPFTPVHYPHGPLPMQPVQAFELGYYNKVPMIFGSVYEDGLLFIYRADPNLLTTAQYIAVATLFFGNHAPDVLLRYPPAPLVGDKRPLLSDVTTQYVFGCANRYYLSQILYDSPNPVYMFMFNHSLSWNGWGPLYPYCEGKVCHGAELPFLFDPPTSGTGVHPTPAEQQMTNDIITWWSNFATSGNPNKPVAPRVVWPAFTNTTKMRLSIMAPNSRPIQNYQGDDCDFWDELGYQFGW